MTTIVQVVQHLLPGGIETMALDLAAFDEDHEKTIIISLEGNHDSAVSNWPHLQSVAHRLIFLDKQPGLTPLLVLRLIHLFKQLQVDVVHTHHIGPLLYAGTAARLTGIKCLIHTEHDAWHLKDPQRCKLQRWINRLTRPLLVADAETVATSMRHYLRLNQIKIIRNGIDTERFSPGDQSKARQRLGLPQDAQLIGCSGRLEPVKGQNILIYALSQLPQTVHLALAGTGSTETDLRHLANILNLGTRVHFLGCIDEMPSFYQALDIFCLPSLNEGMPLSPLEAQACNVPTAVTDVGGSVETLCPLSGELMPAENVDAMASTLREMLQPQRQKSHPGPRAFVQQNRDVRRMARAYANLRYEGV